MEVVGEEEEVLWSVPPFPSSSTATVVASALRAEIAAVMAREMIDRTMIFVCVVVVIICSNSNNADVLIFSYFTVQEEGGCYVPVCCCSFVAA